MASLESGCAAEVMTPMEPIVRRSSTANAKEASGAHVAVARASGMLALRLSC
jgi:hypothetical protein